MISTLPRLLALLLFAGWSVAAYAYVPFAGASAIAAGSGGQHSCALVSGGAKCWGDNVAGQIGDGTTTPALTPVQVSGLATGVSVVAPGYQHTCAIVTGGVVKCWGNNVSGQLGDGTNMQRLTPVSVTGISSGATALALGGAHTCALVSGGVKCWGSNTFGQLGDGTTSPHATPANVSGLTSGVVAIAAGTSHTCAVLGTGAVRCWGLNTNGQIGDGSTTQRPAPVVVSGLTSGGTAVVAGNTHTCALVSGGVKCWGLNTNGQLGDGTQTQQPAPVDVTGLTSGVTAIAAGSNYTCARTTATGMKCWGLNQHGELGDGTLVIRRLTPVDVLGLSTGVTSIAAGFRHTCALIAGGAVLCWGDDTFGALGDNATSQRLAPSLVAGQPNLRAMSAGGLHTCAIVGGGGTARCWGANDSGQLGDNSTTQRQTPVDVSGLATGAVALAAGAAHTCGLTIAGGVKCWGANGSGQLGDNSTTQRLTPVDVAGLTSGVRAIAAGDNHTCALTNAGGIKCWGQNTTGQIGDNTTTQRNAPVDVSGLTSGVTAIRAGATHTCALTTSSGVKCWGWNGFGQIGDNTTTQRNAPVDVSGLGSGVSTIALGQYHGCALVGGGVKCWGWNGYGQIGDNSITQREIPVPVSGLGSGVSGIAAGNGHSCALKSAGGLQCWGDNTYGQVGDGTVMTPRLTAVDVVGVSGASALVVGGLHTCARIGGGLACWGLNSNGQLGDNSVTQRSTATDVSGLTALGSVAGGGTHTCALTVGGGVRCWGGNAASQIGDGTQANAPGPMAVSGLASGGAAVAAGSNHSCAVVSGGGKCWGDNLLGQLGDNTQTPRPTPVDVVGLSGAVFIMASMGGDHSCAIVTGGAAMCWGLNGSGQLGDNSTALRLTPVAVSGLASGVTAMGGGLYHTCALAGGGVKCWGLNTSGQIGDGTMSQRMTPVDVTGLTSGALAVAAGATHSCAVTAAGGVKCWGLNTNGQLGDGTVSLRLAPVNVSGLSSGIVAITAGLSHTCALTTTGGVKCWGLNTNGQLGDGTVTQRLAPVDVSGLTSGVSAIAAGQHHTCAKVDNVGIKCWGENNEGELGDGTMGTRPFPASVLVVGPAARLAITSVNNGNSVAVGTAFNVVVESRDVGDTPAPVVGSTPIALALVGPGALGGTTSCTLAAATKTCTVTGTTINTAQIGALLSASRTSGDALTGGLSPPFDVIATAPGAPTGITAMQVQGGIQVSFTPPANTGGSPITGYTVTCNPGGITAGGTATPIVVTGLVNSTPYTCNVRAINAIGTGAVSSPSGGVFYTVAQRTFVKSTGTDGSSLCAATAPCRTLASALVKTLPGGEVVVLDSAPYDVVTITMPVSILAAAGIFAGVSALPGQSAITIAAGLSDNVFLRGLVITSEGGTNGILFSSGGALYLENMIVRGYAQAGQVNVNFQPAGAAKLSIKDSRIQSGATGLRIANGGGDVGVVVDNVRFENNGTGIKAIANGQLTVRDAIVIDGTQDGINLAAANALPLTATLDRLLVSGNALAGITSGGTIPVYATVSRSTVRGNGGTGIFVSGGGTPSITRVAKSAIVRNVTGVGTGAGGSVLSRGNNTVEANNADGTFSGTYSGK